MFTQLSIPRPKKLCKTSVKQYGAASELPRVSSGAPVLCILAAWCDGLGQQADPAQSGGSLWRAQGATPASGVLGNDSMVTRRALCKLPYADLLAVNRLGQSLVCRTHPALDVCFSCVGHSSEGAPASLLSRSTLFLPETAAFERLPCFRGGPAIESLPPAH